MRCNWNASTLPCTRSKVAQNTQHPLLKLDSLRFGVHQRLVATHLSGYTIQHLVLVTQKRGGTPHKIYNTHARATTNSCVKVELAGAPGREMEEGTELPHQCSKEEGADV